MAKSHMPNHAVYDAVLPQEPEPFLTHAFAVQAGRVIGPEAISDI